jgi:hypothetical protein
MGTAANSIPLCRLSALNCNSKTETNFIGARKERESVSERERERERERRREEEREKKS